MQAEVSRAMKKVEDSADATGDALDNETKRGSNEAARNVKSGMGKAESHMKSATDSMKRMLGAVAAAFTVDKIVDGLKEVMETAAEFKATESQFNQVFGDMEDTASTNLSKIAKSAGMLESNMKGSYTKIAAFAKTTGADTATAMSIADRSMVAVADSAAFYDRTLEETTESLQSFLKGRISCSIIW